MTDDIMHRRKILWQSYGWAFQINFGKSLTCIEPYPNHRDNILLCHIWVQSRRQLQMCEHVCVGENTNKILQSLILSHRYKGLFSQEDTWQLVTSCESTHMTTAIVHISNNTCGLRLQLNLLMKKWNYETLEKHYTKTYFNHLNQQLLILLEDSLQKGRCRFAFGCQKSELGRKLVQACHH